MNIGVGFAMSDGWTKEKPEPIIAEPKPKASKKKVKSNDKKV